MVNQDTNRNNTIYDCVIIGGGAAGLMCGASFSKPVNGLILEGTSRVGTKLLTTGGGHCNITHSGLVKEFLTHYNSPAKRFRTPLYKYNNEHLIRLLEANGLPTVTDEDGRVLPESMRARDVLDMFTRLCQQNGFRTWLDAKVTSLTPDGDVWNITITNGTVVPARAVVIATGGCSFPRTGSDGEMFEVIRRDLGAAVTELAPSLAPIKVEKYPFVDISGFTMDAAVSIKSKLGSSRIAGSLLLTHTDFSGPAALNSSRYACPGASFTINYLIDVKQDEAFARIQQAASGSKADLSTIITREFGLAKRFAKIMAERAGGSTKRLAALLTSDNYLVSGTAGYAQAMVTRGGIDTTEVDGKTLEIKRAPGCYAIGEVLNVDGDTGGYNLQFAYSTACAAAAAIEDTI